MEKEKNQTDPKKKILSDYSHHLNESKKVLEGKEKMNPGRGGARPGAGRRPLNPEPAPILNTPPESKEAVAQVSQPAPTAVGFQIPGPTPMAPLIGTLVAFPFKIASDKVKVPEVALTEIEQEKFGTLLDQLRQLYVPFLNVEDPKTAFLFGALTEMGSIVWAKVELAKSKKQNTPPAPKSPVEGIKTVQPELKAEGDARPITQEFFLQHVKDQEPT